VLTEHRHRVHAHRRRECTGGVRLNHRQGCTALGVAVVVLQVLRLVEEVVVGMARTVPVLVLVSVCGRAVLEGVAAAILAALFSAGRLQLEWEGEAARHNPLQLPPQPVLAVAF